MNLINISKSHEKIIRNWKTENTYGSNFDYCPSSSGVYVIEMINTNLYCDEFMDREIIYVGRARNLKRRKTGHEVIRVARGLMPDNHFIFYWRTCNDYAVLEKRLIRLFNPKLNKQFNG